jgi:hypothetical protein
MLSPESDRFDYGSQLKPPYINGIQYEFDAAIATTYSLNLDTLLAAPIALCFDDTLEGDLRGEKIALLEALGQLKGRLRVFYQQGNITVPREYNRLFTLLEPCLKGVVPDGGEHASFHPKLWLIRYKQANTSARKAKVFYRLIVLSRNLTFDRSWDLAASLDGELTKDKHTEYKSDSWADFFIGLLKNEDQTDFKSTFKKELPKIKWTISYGRQLKLLPGGGNFDKPLDLHNTNDSIMVVSPFLKDSGGQIKALNWLATKTSDPARILLSRATELDAIGSEKLKDWDCYAINDALVDGAEKLELDKEPQNLHAKLIITQRGNTSHWHLGSANATTAALGNADQTPRNNEFMLRFTGETSQIGPNVMLNNWLTDKEGEGLFVPHKFSSEQEEHDSEEFDFRRFTFSLIKAKWNLNASIDRESGRYDLILTHNIESNELDRILTSCDVEVGQLSLPNQSIKLKSKLRWCDVGLCEISALIPVKLKAKGTELEPQKTVIIQAEIDIEGGDHRHKQVLTELLNSEEKLLNYIRLLLNSDSTKEDWLSIPKKGKGTGQGASLFDHSPIYEQLMFAAARDPAALLRIQTLLDRIENTEVKIPEQFLSLWQHFKHELKVNE